MFWKNLFCSGTKKPRLALHAFVILAGAAIGISTARAETNTASTAVKTTSSEANQPRISHPSVPDLADFVGSWIWDSTRYDRQACRLWRSFDIPNGPEILQARLLLTADNEFTVFLDGRE